MSHTLVTPRSGWPDTSAKNEQVVAVQQPGVCRVQSTSKKKPAATIVSRIGRKHSQHAAALPVKLVTRRSGFWWHLATRVLVAALAVDTSRGLRLDDISRGRSK